jgi:ferredoxin-NADP reductase
VRTFTLALPDWRPHRAGQHYDLRLTAEDGYQAQRSYSIASEPTREGEVDLTIERIEEGEVSPYMHDVVVSGDLVEVRGPIGGYFVWDAAPDDARPVLLVGGGSGVVPLMAMLRHHAAIDHKSQVHLVYSARTAADLLYRRELADLADLGGDRRAVTVTLTRDAAPGWSGRRGRVDADLLAEAGWPPTAEPRCYVCGPTPFVEAAAQALVALGHQPANIRTERFGPTGG